MDNSQAFLEIESRLGNCELALERIHSLVDIGIDYVNDVPDNEDKVDAILYSMHLLIEKALD